MPAPHTTLDLDRAWGLYDKQARFVANNSLFSLFLGGVGSGKSHALTAWAVRRALLNPGAVGAILGRTGNDLAAVLLPALFERLEDIQTDSGVCFITDYDKGLGKISLLNGASIFHRPFNRIAKIRSLTLTWVCADEVEWSEANPDEIWTVLTGRMRGHGPVPGLAFATSPNGLRGITKKFVDAQRYYSDARASMDLAELAKWGRFHVTTATSFDNPHNPPHFYESLRAMSKRRYQQEVEGKVLRPQNTVLSLEQRHLIPWRWQAHPELPRVYGIDWGTSGNHVALMFQVTPAGRWVCADELIVDDHCPRGQFQDRLHRWIDGHGKNPPVLLAADRACPQENQALQVKYRQTPVRWMESREDMTVTNGIENLRDMMDPLDGEPMLIFSDSLAQTVTGQTAPVIPALRGYCYFLDSDGQPTTKPKKDNVNDHAVDGLRYAVTAGANDPKLHGGKRLWSHLQVVKPAVATTPGYSGRAA